MSRNSNSNLRCRNGELDELENEIATNYNSLNIQKTVTQRTLGDGQSVEKETFRESDGNANYDVLLLD